MFPYNEEKMAHVLENYLSVLVSCLISSRTPGSNEIVLHVLQCNINPFYTANQN